MAMTSKRVRRIVGEYIRSQMRLWPGHTSMGVEGIPEPDPERAELCRRLMASFVPKEGQGGLFLSSRTEF